MKQQLKKVWNTIRYGDKKIVAYTLLIIILFVAAAVLFASAYTHSAITHAILGIAMIGIDLYLLSRLVDEEVEEEEKREKIEEEVPASSWADKIRHKTPSFKLGEANDFIEEDAFPEKEKEEKEESRSPSFLPSFPKISKSEQKEKKQGKKQPKKKKPKGFKKVRVTFPKEDGSKEQITMFLKSYKVKQNHITVLIDNSKKYNIKECPGYLWPDKKGIHILLLEEPTREIVLPTHSVTNMVYKRGISGDSRKEYLELREPSLKSAIFSSYIPEYYDAGAGGLFSGIQQAKNLYQIAPDIQFSEKCAKEIMDLLNLNFVVYDKYTKSDKFSDYFKAGHRFQVLLRDKVIDPEEYKNKIQILLKRMVVANINNEVFDDTIRQMVMYNMIGADNGDYYRSQRARILEERENNQKKGRKKKR